LDRLRLDTHGKFFDKWAAADKLVSALWKN
jgi:hypothetical protein